MRKTKKFLTYGLVLALGVLTFSGCGGSDKKSGDSGKSENSGSSDSQAVKVIDVDLTSEEYAFGVDKDKEDLLTQVNDFIKEK